MFSKAQNSIDAEAKEAQATDRAHRIGQVPSSLGMFGAERASFLARSFLASEALDNMPHLSRVLFL